MKTILLSPQVPSIGTLENQSTVVDPVTAVAFSQMNSSLGLVWFDASAMQEDLQLPKKDVALLSELHRAYLILEALSAAQRSMVASDSLKMPLSESNQIEILQDVVTLLKKEAPSITADVFQTQIIQNLLRFLAY